MSKTTARQLAGHCKECGDPVYVGDMAQIANSTTTADGLEFTCEVCLLASGVEIPADEPIH